MRRRPTIGEKLDPIPSEFVLLATELVPRVVDRLISFLWEALAQLDADVISRIDVTGDEEELERSLTEYLIPRLNRVIPHEFPFYAQHAAREYETRKAAPAQPPEYDFAFKPWIAEGVMLPVEAKVLKTDGRTAQYVAEVTNNFVPCRYAPFSSEAFMLGYLVEGDPATFFTNLSKALGCELEVHPGFASHSQRRSRHDRIVPPGKAYPALLVLHHLVHRLN